MKYFVLKVLLSDKSSILLLYTCLVWIVSIYLPCMDCFYILILSLYGLVLYTFLVWYCFSLYIIYKYISDKSVSVSDPM